MMTSDISGLTNLFQNDFNIFNFYVQSIMEMQLPQDFKEFLKLLNEQQVEYLLIGGYAVGYHGYPRATNDLDIWIAIHPENAQRIVSTLQEFGFNLPELNTEIFLAPDSIVRMGIPPMRLEILTS